MSCRGYILSASSRPRARTARIPSSRSRARCAYRESSGLAPPGARHACRPCPTAAPRPPGLARPRAAWPAAGRSSCEPGPGRVPPRDPSEELLRICPSQDLSESLSGIYPSYCREPIRVTVGDLSESLSWVGFSSACRSRPATVRRRPVGSRPAGGGAAGGVEAVASRQRSLMLRQNLHRRIHAVRMHAS